MAADVIVLAVATFAVMVLTLVAIWIDRRPRVAAPSTRQERSRHTRSVRGKPREHTRARETLFAGTTREAPSRKVTRRRLLR